MNIKNIIIKTIITVLLIQAIPLTNMEKAFAMNDENINYELKEEENFELIKDMFELNGEYTGDEQNNVELLLDMDKIEKELDSVEIELEDELSEELIISKMIHWK